MSNADYERDFTSTGHKILKHPDAIKKFQDTGIATPIVMHLMLTSECQLRCEFCSVWNRKQHENISFDSIKWLMPQMRELGLRAVILSGGGEPLLHPEFEEIIAYLASQGLKIGVITNGLKLSELSETTINSFTWVRISLNALDYVKASKLRLPFFNKNTVLGGSYI